VGVIDWRLDVPHPDFRDLRWQHPSVCRVGSAKPTRRCLEQPLRLWLVHEPDLRRAGRKLAGQGLRRRGQGRPAWERATEAQEARRLPWPTGMRRWRCLIRWKRGDPASVAATPQWFSEGK
jgi:hypothetical protein